MQKEVNRKFPIGAEFFPEKGVHFRVWASNHQEVTLVLNPEQKFSLPIKMENEYNSYFTAWVPNLLPNTLYGFKFINDTKLYSDPASRFQPFGSDGPSSVIDSDFAWEDQDWPGINLENQIIYEMHIGTFTPSGTFQEASTHLKYLADLGVTIIELMPVNDFPGDFGWGYDGVNLFAPTHLYGRPEDLKDFINKAHQHKLAVILDVVYNHLGPEHNHLIHFSRNYIKEKINEWGNSINFDLAESRNFFLSNAQYWIEEFHFDGLRIDATYCIFSEMPINILKELALTVKNSGGKRNTIVIGEDEPQNSQLIMPFECNGYGFDGLWNDDFHHSTYVRLMGKNEAYYSGYLGNVQELISSVKYGYLYQGQFYSWQKKHRGIPNFNIPHQSMIIFLENHDQIANTADGRRLHQKTDPGNYRAMTALLLLSPNTPLLFQGQEYGSLKRFVYFAQHNTELNSLVAEGRANFLKQFPSLGDEEAISAIPCPSDPEVFQSCKLDLNERNEKLFRLHKDLITLRTTDYVFKQIQKVKVDGAVLNQDCFLIRYFGPEDHDRLIIFNFGLDLDFNPSPEPLLANRRDQQWQLLWSSEATQYGGLGIRQFKPDQWIFPGHSAMVFKITEKKGIIL